ncbi:hypothetical protein Tco_0106567, partial [Tanacetum coccineum]
MTDFYNTDVENSSVPQYQPPCHQYQYNFDSYIGYQITRVMSLLHKYANEDMSLGSWFIVSTLITLEWELAVRSNKRLLRSWKGHMRNKGKSCAFSQLYSQYKLLQSR